jgi:cytochrome bd-type quinol oxidase subunit 2
MRRTASGLLVLQAVLVLINLAVSVVLRDDVGDADPGNAFAGQLGLGPVSLTPVGIGYAVLLAGALLAAAFVTTQRGGAFAWIVSAVVLLGFLGGGIAALPYPAKSTAPNWYESYSGFSAALIVLASVTVVVLTILDAALRRRTPLNPSELPVTASQNGQRLDSTRN